MKGISENGPPELLVFISHGTYGHFDDAQGALILATSYQSRISQTTVLLRGDGVYMAIPDQEPNDIGLESLNQLLESFVEMGGEVVVLKDDLKKRGIEDDEVIDWLEYITEEELPNLLMKVDHSVNF